MSLRGALVYCPGSPFSLAPLFPQAGLAHAARILEGAGQTPMVYDFGAPSFLQRLYPPELRGCFGTHGGWKAARGIRQRRTINRGCARQLEIATREAAAAVARDAPAFVVLWMASRSCARAAFHMAAWLRRERPRRPILAAGPWAVAHQAFLDNADSPFTAVLPESGPPLDDNSGPRKSAVSADEWRLPLSILGEAGTGTAALNEGVGYAPDVYPAVHEGRKLPVFSLSVNDAAIGARTGPFTVSALERLGGEARGIARVTGSRVFWAALPFEGTTHAEVLAGMLEAYVPGMLLACRVTPGARERDSSVPRTGLLAALGLNVYSGSQRLIEDIYGLDFSVSETIALIRECQQMGLPTAAHFRFPSVWDDYHTRAETIRLVECAAPAGITLARADMAANGAPMAYDPAGEFHELLLRLGPAANAAPAIRVPRKGYCVYQANSQRESLAFELLQMDGVAWCSERMGLLARLAGAESHLTAFTASVYDGLARGDRERLEELVARVNANARFPRYFQPAPSGSFSRVVEN